jgi:DNA-directed RNA polymerase specialized sigma24 family protein
MSTTGRRAPETDHDEAAGSAPFAPEPDPDAAFEAAFRNDYDRIRSVCSLALGDPRLADRVTRKAFVRVRRSRHGVGTGERLSVRVYREVFGSVRAGLRRLRGRLSPRGRRPVTAGPHDLAATLAVLDERTRAALLLADIEGFTSSEVLAATGVPAASLSDRLATARAAAVEAGAFGNREALRDALVRACDAPPGGPAAARAWSTHQRDHRRSVAVGRVVTIVAVGAVAAAAALALSRAGGGPVGDASISTPSTSDARLPPGTYRLPGLSFGVSVSVPDGWRAGDSVWGPDGQGFVVITSGKPSASIGIAIFDLGRLRPFDPIADPPRAAPHPVGPAWYERFRPRFERLVEPRVRDRVVGSRVTWSPPAVLAWLLTHTDRRPIGFAEEVSIAGREGDLVEFEFPGPLRHLLRVPGAGTIDLRPGVGYTFWVPNEDDRIGRSVVVGIARELGAAPGTAEWDVIRTLRLGP